MKVIVLEGPCVITCDGDMLIEKYESPPVVNDDLVAVARALFAGPPETPQEPAERPVAPREPRGHIQYPHTRKSPRRRRKTCEQCQAGYLGIGQQRYCSGKCKRAFYRAHGSGYRAV